MAAARGGHLAEILQLVPRVSFAVAYGSAVIKQVMQAFGLLWLKQRLYAKSNDSFGLCAACCAVTHRSVMS